MKFYIVSAMWKAMFVCYSSPNMQQQKNKRVIDTSKEALEYLK